MRLTRSTIAQRADAGSCASAIWISTHDHRALWIEMVKRHGLRPFPYERAPRWAQGDYRAPGSRMSCEYDVLSDTLKLRQHGYAEAQGSGEMFLRLFERCRRERVIP